MRFAVRWAFRLLILLIVLGVSLLLLKDSLLKSLAENRIRAQTGLEVTIGKFELDLVNPTLRIQDFVLYNSSHFGGSPFLNLAELHVEYDRRALSAQLLHLKLVRFNLAEINIVQDEAGETNLQALQDGLSAQPPEAAAALEFTGIDLLNLSIGKLRFTNLKHPNQPREVDVGIKNELVKNVKSAADLSSLLFKILLQKGLNPWIRKA